MIYIYMSLLIKNKSRSTPLIISINSLFSKTKLATLTLKEQETTNIPAENLRIRNVSTNPSAVMISVKTPKNHLLWEGPVPISSNSSLVTINPKTKSVFYGETRLPSIIQNSDRSMIPISGIIIIIIIIFLVWFIVVRSNNKSR